MFLVCFYGTEPLCHSRDSMFILALGKEWKNLSTSYIKEKKNLEASELNVLLSAQTKLAILLKVGGLKKKKKVVCLSSVWFYKEECHLQRSTFLLQGWEWESDGKETKVTGKEGQKWTRIQKEAREGRKKRRTEDKWSLRDWNHREIGLSGFLYEHAHTH